MTHPLAPLLLPLTRFLLEQVCWPAEKLGTVPFSGFSEKADSPPLFPADQLAAEAARQGVAGLLHQWAQRNAGTPVADQLAASLAPQLHANAIHALKLLNDTVRVVDLLKQAGIESLVLKGPLLSKRYYGDWGTRNAGDVDILVAEENVVRADQALRDNAYRRHKPERELSRRRLDLYLDTQHEFGYRPPSGSGLVELHWRFADCPALSPQRFADMWAGSELQPTASHPLRTLGPADTFIQLATHGAMDGWSALKWIADLPRVHAALCAADLAAMQCEAASDQTCRMLQLALALAGGGPARPWMDTAFGHARNRMTSLAEPASIGAKLRAYSGSYRYLHSLAESPAARRAMSYANLIMPADFDRLPLPDALTPALPWLAQCGRGIRKLLG